MDATLYNAMRTEILAANGKRELDELGTKIVLRGSEKIHDIEHTLEYRRRFRGNFSTVSLAAYADYLNGVFSDNDQIGKGFVDRNSMKCQYIFDIGTIDQPGHCQHTAELLATKTAAFIAFLKIKDKRISQQEAAEFVEDWNECFPEAGKLVAGLRAVKITTSGESNSVVDTRHMAKSAMESVTAASHKDLPEQTVFKCEPYTELELRNFQVRINVVGDKDGGVNIIFKSIGFENEVQKIADEFVEKISKSVEGAKFIVGTFDAR